MAHPQHQAGNGMAREILGSPYATAAPPLGSHLL
jgi:hypothetical protein